MKDLTEIMKNINRNGMVEHKEIIIDDFAKSIINKVFDQLSKIFPAWQYNWKTQKEIDGAKMEWTKAFAENKVCTMEQIKYGFLKARASESDFLPSCGKFISWCTPSPEDLGYPSEQQALKRCVDYKSQKKMGMKTYARPLIVELCKRVDWWLMNTASTQQQLKKAEKHFKETYLDLISSGYQEPQETTHERLETTGVVRDRMSSKQLEDGRIRGLDVMADIKKKLKSKLI